VNNKDPWIDKALVVRAIAGDTIALEETPDRLAIRITLRKLTGETLSVRLTSAQMDALRSIQSPWDLRCEAEPELTTTVRAAGLDVPAHVEIPGDVPCADALCEVCHGKGSGG
jgi:hypothetical protein